MKKDTSLILNSRKGRKIWTSELLRSQKPASFPTWAPLPVATPEKYKCNEIEVTFLIEKSGQENARNHFPTHWLTSKEGRFLPKITNSVTKLNQNGGRNFKKYNHFSLSLVWITPILCVNANSTLFTVCLMAKWINEINWF